MKNQSDAMSKYAAGAAAVGGILLGITAASAGIYGDRRNRELGRSEAEQMLREECLRKQAEAEREQAYARGREDGIEEGFATGYAARGAELRGGVRQIAERGQKR